LILATLARGEVPACIKQGLHSRIYSLFHPPAKISIKTLPPPVTFPPFPIIRKDNEAAFGKKP
jgi:hypothetical protein